MTNRPSKQLRAWRLRTKIQETMLKLRRDIVKLNGYDQQTDKRHDTLQKRLKLVNKYLYID